MTIADTANSRKVVVLGDGGVGKTSIIRAWNTKEHRMRPYRTTIGFERHNIAAETTTARSMTLDIWDISGQQHFKKWRKQLIEGAQAAIVVFDLTARRSFDHVDMWLSYAIEGGVTSSKALIIGNKQDLYDIRAVSVPELVDWSSLKGIPSIETSVKDNNSIEEALAFLSLIAVGGV